MTAPSAGAARREAGRAGVGLALALLLLSTGCAVRSPRTPPDVQAATTRREAIARARVWSRTNVGAMDVRRGPGGRKALAPEALVECTYVPQRLDGRTPKFLCALPGGERVKVKYGRDNGEVYAEVAATRLLWALGFGADHVYPVRVRCHGCPDDGSTEAVPGATRLFEVATIERRRAGREFDEDDSGWSWQELDEIAPGPGGASRAERDALKLLAAMLQHTDSKRDQQRLVCDGPTSRDETCARPFLFISDVGKTFGTANILNRDAPGSVNLDAWARTRVWADDKGCRANVAGSLTGTLEHPVISDAGRRFLVGLLRRLTDRQLRELFAVSRFPMRAHASRAEQARVIDAWIEAFRDKVDQIDRRACAAGAPAAGAVARAR
jgi:hypothetical protein